MKGILKFNFKANRNRKTVLQFIRDRLYPENEFPDNLFPDLQPVLFNYFMNTIASQKDLLEIYRDSAEPAKIEKLAEDILVFKNLLGNHPQTVVLVYRTYIKRFIKYRHANSDEWEDIFQEVITRLISGKIYRIREKFDFNFQYEKFSPRSFFTSYLMVTVRNIYMDILRERKVRPLTGGEVQPVDDSVSIFEDKQMFSRLVIDEEFRKFRAVLTLFYKSRPRLELCLKLKCRIPLSEKDIRRCFPFCSGEDIKVLEQDFKATKDKALFDTVVPVFNRCESTDNKSDTLRKWVSIKVDEIAAHLNHTHGCGVYNSKNFVDLVSLYYECFSIDESDAFRNPGHPDRR